MATVPFTSGLVRPSSEASLGAVGRAADNAAAAMPVIAQASERAARGLASEPGSASSAVVGPSQAT